MKSYLDKRGWPKGRHRKYTNLEEQRVLEIRERIVNKERRYYWGGDTIKKEYQELYPKEPLITDWFVDEVIPGNIIFKFPNQRNVKEISFVVYIIPIT